MIHLSKIYVSNKKNSSSLFAFKMINLKKILLLKKISQLYQHKMILAAKAKIKKIRIYLPLIIVMKILKIRMYHNYVVLM